MSDQRDDGAEGRIDHRFLQTQRVRVRAKNPQIERKASLRPDSSTQAGRTPAEAPPRGVRPKADPADVVPKVTATSLYDRLEESGRSEELDETRAQLEAALWAEGTDPELMPRLVRPARTADSGPRTDRASAPLSGSISPGITGAPSLPPPPPPTDVIPSLEPAPPEDAGTEAAPIGPRTDTVPSPTNAPERFETRPARPAPIAPASAPTRPQSDETQRGRSPVAQDRQVTEPAGRHHRSLAEPAAVAVADLLDDDATVVADGPPSADLSRATAGAVIKPREDALGRGPREDALGRGPRDDAAVIKPREDALGRGPREDALGRGPREDGKPGKVERPQEAGRARAGEPAGDKSTEARPRTKMAGYGTKAVGAELRRQKLIREVDVPELSHSSLRRLAGFVEPNRLRRLDAVLDSPDDEFEATFSSKRALELLLNDPSFVELAIIDQGALLTTVADAEADLTTVKSTLALTRATRGHSLSAQDFSDLHGIYSRLDLENRARFARLAARPIRSRSALVDRDWRQHTLLRNLRTLVEESDIDSTWTDKGLQVDAVCSLVIGTLAQPVRLSADTGDRAVHALLEFVLADVHPAEFARLWCGVLSRHDTLPLSGGLRLDTAVIRGQPQSETPLRGLFAALAEHVRPTTRSNRRGYRMPEGPGLDADVTARALEQLFGVGYTVAAGDQAALRHLELLDADGERRPPALVSILHPRGERLFVFDRIEQGDIYLRSPHGRSTKRAGQRRSEPDREVILPDLGLDRVSRRDFQETAGAALVPRC